MGHSGLDAFKKQGQFSVLASQYFSYRTNKAGVVIDKGTHVNQRRRMFSHFCLKHVHVVACIQT